MSKINFDITTNTSGFTAGMNGVVKQLQQVEDVSRQSGLSIDSLAATLKKAAASLGVAFGAKEFVSKVMTVRGEFQQLEIAFETMLGSEEKASSLMSQLIETAAKTPFDMKGVTQGAKQLLAYGIAADDVNETLTRLGDIASGLSIPLGDLVYLYGTTMTQGRMFTMDLRQFMGRGVPIAEELAKQFGVTKEEVSGLVSAGKVGAEEFKQAIWSLTDEGSKFGGLMAKQSASITGQLSNIGDSVEQMINSIGKSAEPIINAAMSGVSAVVENYEEIGKLILEAAAAYGTYRAVLISVTAFQKAFTYAQRLAAIQQVALTNAQIAGKVAMVALKTPMLALKAAADGLKAGMAQLNATMLANPYVAVAAAVAALGFGIYKLATYQTDAEKQQKRLAEAMAEGEKNAVNERIALAELYAKLEAAQEGTDEYAKAKQELIDKYSKYGVTLDDETLSVQNLAGTYDRLTDAINRSYAAKAKADFISSETQSYNDLVSENLAKIKEDILKGAEEGQYSYEDAFAVYGEISERVLKGDIDRLYSGVESYAEQGFSDIVQKIVYARDFSGFVNNAKVMANLNEIVQSRELLDKVKSQVGSGLVRQEKPSGTGKASTIYGAEYEAAKKEWQEARKGLEEIEKDRNSFSTEQYKKAQERLKNAKEAFEGLGGDTKSGKSASQENDALEGDGKKEDKPVVKNKKYWEDKEKEIQWELDAMSDEELKTKKAIALKKELISVQAKLKKRDVSYSSTTTATNKAETKAERRRKKENQQKVQQAQLSEQADQYDQQQIVAAREFALAVEQAKIDGMQEGYEKELAVNKLNYDKLLEENIKRKEQFVEQLRDMAEVQWKMKNPYAKDNGQSFDRNSVSADILNESYDISKLPQDQQAIIQLMRTQLSEYARFASESYRRANKQSLDNMLGEVLTYEQQRAKITEEYAKKREQMYDHDDTGNRTGLKVGVSQGNVSELDRQEQEALKAVDEQFAQREETYKAWCDSIADYTFLQLEDALTKAKQELAALEKNGGNSTQIAVAKAKINKLDVSIKSQKAANAVAPKKKTIKEWEDLYSTLNECADSFEDIGDAVGGTVGDIIKAAGQIATSTLTMINGIVTLANSSGTAISTTSKTAAAAIRTVETASVILTVISAALQIATAIANMFNDDEEKQHEIEKLQERIDQLEWELDNSDIVRLMRETGDAYKEVAQAYAEALYDAIKSGTLLRDILITGNANQELLEKGANELAKAYANVAYSADKALGAKKYESAQEELKNIGEQQLLIAKQISEESSKKDSDDSVIADYKQKMAELKHEAADLINDLVEDIIGGSSSDIAEQLSDAFFEAFENGEDAAEAWGDSVNEIVADVVKNMLVQKYLEEPIAELFDKYKADWFKDGEFAGIDAVIDSAGSLAADLNTLYPELSAGFEAILSTLPDEVQEYLTGNDAEREASSSGIATASQDSVDENNARLTTIQGHTYLMAERTAVIETNTTQILSHVSRIENYTAQLARLENMEAKLVLMSSTLSDIQSRGLLIKG